MPIQNLKYLSDKELYDIDKYLFDLRSHLAKYYSQDFILYEDNDLICLKPALADKRVSGAILILLLSM